MNLIITPSPIMLLVAHYAPIIIILYTWRGYCKALINYLCTNTSKNDLTLNPHRHIKLINCLFFMLIFTCFMQLIDHTIPLTACALLVVFSSRQFVINHTNNLEPIGWNRIKGICINLAGPISYLILIIITLLTLRIMPSSIIESRYTPAVLSFVSKLINIASGLFIIDMIPIPPFDAGKIMPYIMPKRVNQQIDYNWLGPIIILLLLIIPDSYHSFWYTLQTLPLSLKNMLISIFL